LELILPMTTEIKISVPADFRFYQTLRDTTRQPFGLTECLIDAVYHTLINQTLVSIRHDKNNQVLLITSSGQVDLLNGIIRLRFGLDQNLADFYSRQYDLELRAIISRLSGLRLFQKSTPFESLVTAIVDQQLNLAFAEKLKRRLITTYGLVHKFNQMNLYEFPTPQTLAALDDEALRPMQFSNNKSRFVIRLARKITNGEISLNSLNGQTDVNLYSKLISIYGIGPWTAEYAAMVGFNRMNAFPAADIGLLNALKAIYRMEKRPIPAEAHKIANRWEPYRGLMTFYIWYAFEQGFI